MNGRRDNRSRLYKSAAARASRPCKFPCTGPIAINSLRSLVGISEPSLCASHGQPENASIETGAGMPFDPADLIYREAATAWGRTCPCAHERREGGGNGANAMRAVLALGLLIALYTSADAARVHHFKPRHVIVRPSQGLTLGSAVPGWAYAPPQSPIHHDDPPSYNDPSKFGGQPLGIDP